MKKYTILICLAILGVMIGSVIPQRGTGDLWYSQYLVLFFFICLTPSFILWNFNKFLSILLAALTFSTFFVSQLHPRPIILLTQIFSLSLISFGISKVDKNARKWIRRVFLLVFILQSALLILQFFNIDPLFNSLVNPLKDDTVGFMASKDQLGSVQAIINPILISFNPFFLVVSSVIVGISKSFFSVIALILSTGILVWFNFRKYLKYFILFFTLLGIVFIFRVDKVNLEQVKSRVNPWKCAISSTLKGSVNIDQGDKNITIRCNPLLGYGFGNFSRIFPYIPSKDGFNFQDEKFVHAHNDIVEFFFETGIAGLLILLTLIISLILEFIRSKKSTELVVYFSCLVAYLVSMQGNFVSHIAVTGCYLAVIYGMYEGTRREING